MRRDILKEIAQSQRANLLADRTVNVEVPNILRKKDCDYERTTRWFEQAHKTTLSQLQKEISSKGESKDTPSVMDNASDGNDLDSYASK